MQAVGQEEHEQFGDSGELVNEGFVPEDTACAKPPFALLEESLLSDLGLGACDLAICSGKVEVP